MTIVSVPLTEFDRCVPWLDAAINKGWGTHTIEDVRQQVLDGTAQLWPAPRGAMVTEVVTFPRRKVMNIFLAGGDLDQLLEMETDATEWCKGWGATGVMLHGRKGWEKVLAERGYRHLYTVLGKDF
jgi:hypothetical protein